MEPTESVSTAGEAGDRQRTEGQDQTAGQVQDSVTPRIPPRPPGDGEDGQRCRRLHGDSESGQTQGPPRALGECEGDTRHREADHQRVVVDSRDEDEEHGRVGHAGGHRLDRIDATGVGGPCDTPRTQDQAGDDGQPPFLDGHPWMPARRPRKQAGKVDLTGSVDGGSGEVMRIDGSEPGRVVSQEVDGIGRTQTGRHQPALGDVDPHVLAGERSRKQQGRGPRGGHPPQAAPLQRRIRSDGAPQTEPGQTEQKDPDHGRAEKEKVGHGDTRTGVRRTGPPGDGRALPCRGATGGGQGPDTTGVRPVGRGGQVAGQCQQSGTGGTQRREADRAHGPCVFWRGRAPGDTRSDSSERTLTGELSASAP